jgi:hypothetical protein
MVSAVCAYPSNSVHRQGKGGSRIVPNYSQLLSSRQYLTLDLLEGLCARAREVTQSAFDRGESLSNEELFNLIMVDMACRAEELRDLQGLLAEAETATGHVLEELQGARPAASVASISLRSLPELNYLSERHHHIT